MTGKSSEHRMAEEGEILRDGETDSGQSALGVLQADVSNVSNVSNVDPVMGGDARSAVITGLNDQREGAKYSSNNDQGKERKEGKEAINTMSNKRKIVEVDSAFGTAGLVDPSCGIVDLCSSSSSSSNSSDEEQDVQDGKDGRDTNRSTARARASNKGGGILRTTFNGQQRNTMVGDIGDDTPHGISISSSASSSGFLAPRARAQAKGGDRESRRVEKVIDLTHYDVDGDDCDMGLDPELSDDKEDSGFIPFTRSFSPDSSLSRKGKVKRENNAKGRGGKMLSTKGTGAGAVALAPRGTSRALSVARVPIVPGVSLHHSAALLRNMNTKKMEDESRLSRLWPSPSRFYRTVLRWVYLPDERTIHHDAPSLEKMMSMPPVPTKFESLLEYQRIMSQLVLMETSASLQQALGGQNGSNYNTLRVEGEICNGCCLEATGGAPGPACDGGKLFSLKIKLKLPRVTDSSGREMEPRCPFWGGDLVGLRSTFWESSKGVAPALGVVQFWDPVYDTKGGRPNSQSMIRVLVYTNTVGGDGAGGPGGWLPLSTVKQCLGQREAGKGIQISLISLGMVMPSSREFQAVMSMTELPKGVQSCLLDPFVSRSRSNGQLPNPRLASSSSSASSSSVVAGDAGTVSHGGGKGKGLGLQENGDGEEEGKGDCGTKGAPAPPNIPDKMWKGLVESFNPSQLAAIRQVAMGSPTGFTLLQGPPGTGKTRTIMGIVGVLLAAGCPYPTGQDVSPSSSPHTSYSHSATIRKGKGATKGVKIHVGASVSSGMMSHRKGSKIIDTPVKSQIKNTRLLVVAPSNAAVDELVMRLVLEGVPGPGVGMVYPRVVRVGGPRADLDEGGGQGDTGRRGKRGVSPVVQEVSLEHLADIRGKATHRGGVVARLDVLLEAQVVCATLSGSGSQALVEALMHSIRMSEKHKQKHEKHDWKAHKKQKYAPKRKVGKGIIGCSDMGFGGREECPPILTFDAVIMDEAAQAVEPSSLIPLKFNPRAVIMVGDPAQLPATIFSQKAKGANYGQSLFLRLQRGGHPRMMLDTQYRMHPSIASFASTRFYQGLLRCASTVTEFSHGQTFHCLKRFAPYLFHNVLEGRLRRGGARAGRGGDESTTSLSNSAEVEYIIFLLRDLVRSFPEMNFNGRVGVIAPYRNQITALQRGMWKTGLRQDGVEVSTVDGFQGREKDIIILSCVRSPEEGSAPNCNKSSDIGFLSDWRRLNVAITRAKHSMWIVGHAGVLRMNHDWRELIDDSKRRGAFLEQSEAAYRNPTGALRARPHERAGGRHDRDNSSRAANGSYGSRYSSESRSTESNGVTQHTLVDHRDQLPAVHSARMGAAHSSLASGSGALPDVHHTLASERRHLPLNMPPPPPPQQPFHHQRG